MTLARVGHPGFEITETPGATCTRLSVRGDLDLASAIPLGRRLRDLQAEGTSVSVDLSQLEFIDGFGARVLIDAVTRSHQGGSRVAVEANMPRQVRRVFELLKAVELSTGSRAAEWAEDAEASPISSIATAASAEPINSPSGS